MSTSKDMLAYILDQLSLLEELAHPGMMGEYVVYYRDKVIGLICDGQLFIKETKAGKALFDPGGWRFSYAGAKKNVCCRYWK